MNISLSTNFDPLLIKKLKKSPVSVVYGKLTSDIVGGGRPSFRLPKVNIEKLEEHIKLVHKCGMEFSYLLNSACLDNLECTKDKNKKIVELLDILHQLKVDWVTVSIPYLVDLVRTRLPHVKINISTFAGVNNFQKIKYYEKLGVHAITLCETVNRNFTFLEKLNKNFSIDFHLMANNACLLSCPFAHHHQTVVSHASQEDHISEGFCIDYCRLKCIYQRLKYPELIIQAPWIRPEDTKFYEDIGIKTFKIADRARGTKQLLRIVKAYQNRNCNGNLMQLLDGDDAASLMPDFEYFNKPNFVDLHKMVGLLPLYKSVNIFIDNKKLEGFLDPFYKEQIDCGNTDCQECGYCASIAKKAIQYDDEEYKVLLQKFEQVFEELNTGKFFNSNDGTQVNWSDASRDLLERMINSTPQKFKAFFSVMIKGKSEGNALERKSTLVTVEDLVAANFEFVPKAYHRKLKRQLRANGVKAN